MPYKNISEACLVELQPVIDLLREEKFFGAESVCDIVAKRFADQEEMTEECRALVSELKAYISRKSSKSLEDITKRHQQLTGALS